MKAASCSDGNFQHKTSTDVPNALINFEKIKEYY